MSRKSKGFHPVKPGNRGKLTRKAKRAGMSVQSFASKEYNAPGKLGKEARFAKIARTWRHGKRKAPKRTARR